MNIKNIAQQILIFLAFIILWKVLIFIFGIREFILPQPEAILKSYINLFSNGILIKHSLITLEEILLGFFIGSFVGIFLGYAIGKSSFLERVLSPYLVASQTVPIIAIAPLLVLWFGFGIESKAIICSLIVFFPILINTIVGIKSVSEKEKELFEIMGASNIQKLIKLEAPSSARNIFAGFKVSITLSVIGAVVGEFTGAGGGLGFLILYSSSLMKTTTIFVGLMQLAIIGIALYVIINIVERLFLPWQFQSKNDIIKQ